MKSKIKLVGFIAIMAVIGFSLIACDDGNGGNGGNSDYEMLNGVWYDTTYGIVVTINNNSGVFTRIYSDSPFSNTSVKIGDQKFKNITKTGNLTWDSENLVYSTPSYSTSWTNTTIALSADGQTLTTNTPGTANITATYTRFPVLNGVWHDATNGIVVTINNNSGVFTEINSNSGWGNTSVKIGDQKFKNITKTGNLTWNSENLVYSTPSYSTSWTNTTIVLSANGQTLTTNTPGTSNVTASFTRK